MCYQDTGRKKTQEKTALYWFRIRESIEDWISQCDPCGAVKFPPMRANAHLGSMRTGAPLDRLSTDLLGPLPLTSRHKRYVLVVNVHFTK